MATVPSTPEQKVSKSANGEGVKNSRKQGTAPTSTAPDGRLCFWSKQPGHLKKDCPELSYCSKCKTQGQIPAKCPSKGQNHRHPNKRCESVNRGSDKRYKKLQRGLEERINPSSLTKTTDVSTVQMITGPMLVQ